MSDKDKADLLAREETGVSINTEYRQMYPFECLCSVGEKMAEWKDKQFEEERKELLGLVEMLPVDERNQSIIEDLIGMLR